VIVLVSSEHESFDLYSIRIPEANESSMPMSVNDNHMEKKGLGMTQCYFSSQIYFCSSFYSVFVLIITTFV